jgi:hypothetical protein
MPMVLGRTRAAVGAVVWLALFFLARARLADPVEGRDLRALWGVSSYLSSRRIPVVARFPEEVELAVGDPVYAALPQGLALLGEVEALLEGDAVRPLLHAGPGDGVREARIRLRAGGPEGPRRGARARLIQVPQTASWVLRTLLPPDKVAQIAVEWNRTLLAHREEIFQALRPVASDLLLDLEEVIQKDLPPALEARRLELSAIGRRLQTEVLEPEFRPLFETELLPIIQRRAQPTLDAIGEEVWQRLPLWGFTWRFLYQTIPLTSDRMLKSEVNRFWREETLPILRAHAGDFLGILEDILKEGADSPRMSGAFKRTFDRVLLDPELQHQLRLVFQEVILDNPQFHQAMARRWESPEVARALEVLGRRLEPMVRRIGDIVLGTRGGGITPEFARVLRTQILEKDRRWVLIENPPGPEEPPLRAWAVLSGEVERP